MINDGHPATVLTNVNDAFTVELDETREGTLVFDIQPSGFTGTVTFECSLDRVNWSLIQGTKLADGSAVTTATAQQTTSFNVSALGAIRARLSAVSGGTVAITAAVANRG